jgi:hypothetical protein
MKETVALVDRTAKHRVIHRNARRAPSRGSPARSPRSRSKTG